MMNGNIPPPCKIDKCICYPSCVTKKDIVCQILKDYYIQMHITNAHLANCNSKCWGNIRTVLPNLITVRTDDVYTPDARQPFTCFNRMDL